MFLKDRKCACRIHKSTKITHLNGKFTDDIPKTYWLQKVVNLMSFVNGTLNALNHFLGLVILQFFYSLKAFFFCLITKQIFQCMMLETFYEKRLFRKSV